MIDALRARCRDVLRPGERVVCAVSGGADSMALLRGMTELSDELGVAVSAAHFNHGLRGADSDADEAFVREYCRENGIFLTVGHGEVNTRGQSLEQAARAARYEFLQKTAHGAWILTAHTADDNLETVLLNLLRGTSLAGLCGIPPVRGRLLRPLLGVTRAQVLAYLEKTGTPHVEDATNAADDALRNRLRHHVVPLLQAETPDLALRTARTCGLLREDEAYLEAQTRALLRDASYGDGYRCSVLREDPLLPRAARRLLSRAGIGSPTARHVAALCDLVQTSDGEARVQLPGGVTARRSYDLLTLSRHSLPETFAPIALQVPGEAALPLGTLCVRAYADGEALPPGALLVPAASELLIRPRMPGDVLRLPGGRRTLKRLMIDRKIPAHLRGLLPVICADGQILAVVGLGVNLDAPENEKKLLIYQKEGAAFDGKSHDC